MYESQQHEMQLEATHPSGAEEWSCPACGRRFLMQWPPAYNMIVLEAGDQYALHSGSKGGLRIGSLQEGEVEDTPLPEEWRTWLEDAGFDEWWDKTT